MAPLAWGIFGGFTHKIPVVSGVILRERRRRDISVSPSRRIGGLGGRGVNRRALEKLRYFRFSSLIPRIIPRQDAA